MKTIIDLAKWKEFLDENTGEHANLDGMEHYDCGFVDGMDMADAWIDAQPTMPVTNRDWLCSLSAVELVEWIKNTAAGMADAELLKWMEADRSGGDV